MRDLNKKGIFTGLLDSNKRPILSGDKIRYEYTVGFSRVIIDGVEHELDCMPFDETKETFHLCV